MPVIHVSSGSRGLRARSLSPGWAQQPRGRRHPSQDNQATSTLLLFTCVRPSSFRQSKVSLAHAYTVEAGGVYPGKLERKIAKIKIIDFYYIDNCQHPAGIYLWQLFQLNWNCGIKFIRVFGKKRKRN